MISAIAYGEKRKGEGKDTMPHVLLLLDQIPRTLGGGERIALRLAEKLPDYGYRASILTFAAAPDSPALKSSPCTIYLLPLERTYDLTALRAAWALRNFIHREQVQVVQTFFESSDLWGGLITKTTRAKLIWSRRDMGILRRRKHEIAYRWMAAMPDAVFAVSEQVRRHSIDVDGIDAARVHTVYNGLDPAQWPTSAERRRSGGEPIWITAVGNIRRVKGQDLLVRAAAKIMQQFPDARFSVAGDVLEEDYFEELKQLVADLGVADRFFFVGPVSDLKAHLAAANIFVLPSRSEGFSNAIVEAMASGLPVVATNVGGNAEAVEDGKTGLIVPSEDEAALADAICRLLSAPEQAIAMGAAGRLRTAELFTIESMMRRIVDTYTKLLA